MPGTHAGFIIASYALAAIVIAGLVISVVLDFRAQKKALQRLEARGLRRRSDGNSAKQP